MRLAVVALLPAALLPVAALASPDPSPDSDADVIHLRNDCDVEGSPLDNCFESTSAVTTWLWGGGRGVEPSENDRVVVQVGPGNFDQFRCEASGAPRGFVSVMGAGRDQTRLRYTGTATVEGEGAYCEGAIAVEGCTDLNFESLTAESHRIGATWTGDGESTWSDVDMLGGAFEGESCGAADVGVGWYDKGGLHYFFGSRAVGMDGSLVLGGFNGAGETWFYGGEIAVDPRKDFGSVFPTFVWGVNAASTGDIRIFGSVVRAVVGPAVSATFSSFQGLRAGGTIHMHGGIVSIDASASTDDVDVYGIHAGSGALVHAPDTAFAIKAAGSGVATRVHATTGANVASPFLWPAGDTPPPIVSVDGYDQFVDTDAGASGGESHLMVYDSGCSAGGGPWRDMSDGSCRP